MAPSPVWIYFTKILQGTKVRCSKCQRELCFNGSTLMLANHLRVAHKIEIKRQRLESSEDADHDPAEDRQINIHYKKIF